MNKSGFLHENEAKALARKFAEERYKAEQEARLWMKKYEELLIKFERNEENSKENSQGNEENSKGNQGFLKELVEELRAWQEKSNENAEIINEITEKNGNLMRINDELEKNLKNVIEELELFQKKYQEISGKIVNYEENIRILKEKSDKSNELLMKKDDVLEKIGIKSNQEKRKIEQLEKEIFGLKDLLKGIIDEKDLLLSQKSQIILEKDEKIENLLIKLQNIDGFIRKIAVLEENNSEIHKENEFLKEKEKNQMKNGNFHHNFPIKNEVILKVFYGFSFKFL